MAEANEQDRSRPPQVVDFLRLPRVAIASHAIRSARRAFPVIYPELTTSELMSKLPPVLAKGFSSTIDEILRLAEQVCAGELPAHSLERMTAQASAIDGYAHELNQYSTASFHLAQCAAKAYQACAAAFTDGVDKMGVSLAAADAASFGAEASEQENSFFLETWRDYRLLFAASHAEGWKDGEDFSIPPEFFGPLWPYGEPEGWPVEASGKHEPRPTMMVNIAVPPGMTEAQSKAFNGKVVELLREMSRLHAGSGGTGLRIIDKRTHQPVLVPDDESDHAARDFPCEVKPEVVNA